MAYNPTRVSTYSMTSTTPRPGNPANAQQVSTQTLLNSLHTCHASGEPLSLESSTSLVVNTWVSASQVGPDGRIGGTVDLNIGRRAFEHARRRAEDGCVVLASLHDSTPSLFAPFISSLPFGILPSSFWTSLEVIKAFTHCVTPANHSTPLYSSLAATFTINLAGNLTGASLALSTSGLNTQRGLLNIPTEPGNRAFDVLYQLRSSTASRNEKDFLDLKPSSAYSLLKRSGTYQPPSYIPTLDDEASADDLRQNLKTIGVKGSARSNIISSLTGLLKLGDSLGFLVDDNVLEQTFRSVSPLLDIPTEVLRKKLDTMEREVFIAAIYEALVDWIIARANETIAQEMQSSDHVGNAGRSGTTTPLSNDDDNSVSITVVEVPGQALGKAVALRTVFDDSQGINLEMKQDGVSVAAPGSSIVREMTAAVTECEADLGIPDGAASREAESARDRREAVLEKVGHELGDQVWLKEVLTPVQGAGISVGKAGRFDLASVLGSSRVWFQLALHPSDDLPSSLGVAASSWSAGTVSRQLRDWRLPEWANRRNKSLDYTADFDIEEFVTRYRRLGCREGRDGVESWITERGWSNGEVVVGHEHVWVREGPWWELEGMIDMMPTDHTAGSMLGGNVGGMEGGYSAQSPGMGSGFFPTQFNDAATMGGSKDNLLSRQYSTARSGLGAPSIAPTQTRTMKSVGGGDYGLGRKGDDRKGEVTYYGELDPELGENKVIVEQPIPKSRKLWVAIVWALTFWIPSPALHFIGRMKRPDVRMAWREKLVLIFIIFFLNAIVVFWIVAFGKLICPMYDKAWNAKEVSYHQGDNDYWISHMGKVYDLSKFWKQQHSDSNIKTTKENMEPFGGTDMTFLIRPPLNLACRFLVQDESLTLQNNNTAALQDSVIAQHLSGPRLQSDPTSKLASIDWYPNVFLPKMKDYLKGDLVIAGSKIKSEGTNKNHQWFVIDNVVYDLTDYFYTKDQLQKDTWFFPQDVEELIQNNPGGDISKKWREELNSTTQGTSMNCLENFFYSGKTDFRQSAKCQVNNYVLLAFTIIVCAVIVVKFLAALQLGSKRRPSPQDKFVICQVPAYTEGEDQLRKGLDSLTALAYDNKRKLICVICDGMIVGGGNDRPTPKIVLDILGVDPKIDPPALPFKSVGAGSEQLNYGKVYSGLYEYEGNVVPYIVVVKVGKESEQHKSKPGNRGKRDSQILLMSFLNRVHHRARMSPLELEMFHQINNIIGVDPEMYEYLFMVDADTMVREDSLNRLVASCANDAKIAGICGETSLENEERSWWTMIQVYEYYISHHLAKAFESLFGSVTCLPGCFCMYRLRTADKGKPLIISDQVINEYSDCNVDTLHKKNLLSLGEDRYLTTLMTKHFPQMSYKFVPDAYALTAAPEQWSILLSQRRRWINSTIHNLAELVMLRDLCGFCCFSMRFVVFIDLFGTVILPATCVYLAYLIYRVATHTGQFPLISIIMLAAVYGLQAVIFIIKRQWQHIGWMIIYILAFPIYSFVLPVYSFWKQDDFSWGNTRIVIGEKGNKQLVAVDDEGFDPRSIPLQRWDDYAGANNLPGRRGYAEKSGNGSNYEGTGYEMDDMQSVYSSVKPASTILTGFPNPRHLPPDPFQGMQRQSTYSNFSRYRDQPSPGPGIYHESHMAMAGAPNQYTPASQQSDPFRNPANPYASNRPSMVALSSDNLMAGMQQQNGSSSNLLGAYGPGGMPRARSPLGAPGSRPMSSVTNFQTMMNGPSDEMIVVAIRDCLRGVELDHLTKKQLMALVEQRLQTSLQGERKEFLGHMIDVELANL